MVSHEDNDNDSVDDNGRIDGNGNGNNGNDVPKKLTKRRIQQHLNTSVYRTFRRKSKTNNRRVGKLMRDTSL